MPHSVFGKKALQEKEKGAQDTSSLGPKGLLQQQFTLKKVLEFPGTVLDQEEWGISVSSRENTDLKCPFAKKAC